MKAILSLAIAGLLAGACGTVSNGTPSRQDEVARKGATVMPFDLARTTHFFDDNATGGVQTVTANEKLDPVQVDLVRAHLATEAEHFARGDFSDPARIHGNGMPGLQALARGSARLRVTYRDIPGGASLAFSSDDPALVEAIHAWFAAQRSDHDAHAHHHG